MLDANGNKRAFIRDPNGGRTMLGTLGGRTSSAWKLNDKNQVVGSSETACGVNHAFVSDSTGGMVDLETLGGVSSRADTINNAGLVFGHADTAVAEFQPFVWEPNEGMVALPIQRATDLNNESYAIGQHHFPGDGTYAVTWRRDTGLVRLFKLEGGFHNSPMINDAGQVVYDAPYRSRWEGLKRRFPLFGRNLVWFQWCLWDPQHGRVSIDQYVPTRFSEMFLPLALNNKGCIVGAIMSKKGAWSKAVLLEPIEEKWSP